MEKTFTVICRLRFDGTEMKDGMVDIRCDDYDCELKLKNERGYHFEMLFNALAASVAVLLDQMEKNQLREPDVNMAIFAGRVLHNLQGIQTYDDIRDDGLLG